MTRRSRVQIPTPLPSLAAAPERERSAESRGSRLDRHHAQRKCGHDASSRSGRLPASRRTGRAGGYGVRTDGRDGEDGGANRGLVQLVQRLEQRITSAAAQASSGPDWIRMGRRRPRLMQTAHVVAVGFAALFGIQRSAPRDVGAHEILARTARVYAECKTYRDSGIVRTLFIQDTRNRTVTKPFT